MKREAFFRIRTGTVMKREASFVKREAFLVAAAIMVSILAGCAGGAKLMQEHENGGVVVYPFKGDQGSLLSSFRKEALAIMKEKCGGAYDIVREGEAKGRARVVSPLEGEEEVIQERRWGIQFQCK